MKTKAFAIGLMLSCSGLVAAVPTVRFSTFVGGSGLDMPMAIAADPTGSVYVAGYASAGDFPGAVQIDGGGNCFVQKLSADGATVHFTALISGCFPRAMAVNAAGEVFIAGHTFDQVPDAVLMKLNAAGNQIVFRRNFGGLAADGALAIASNPATGQIWVAGLSYSADFPTAGQPFQSTRAYNVDGFLTRFSSDGTMEYSTYFGGAAGDTIASGLALDSQGRPILVGHSSSPELPTLNAFQSATGGSSDAFIARFDGTGRALLSSTYLGGDDSDWGAKCALDAAGNIYITGMTSSANFPLLNAAQTAPRDGADVFVAKLNPTASALVYSTYLGSSLEDFVGGWPYEIGATRELSGGGISVTPSGRALVVGSTFGGDFPIVDGLRAENEQYWVDGFATLFEADGQIGFSTYIGGENIDSGIATASVGEGFLMTGATSPGWRLPIFPRTPGSSHAFSLSSQDGYVLKLDAGPPPLGNDSFANAAMVQGLESTLFVQTGAASKEPSEPNHAGNAGGKSVWFRWTAPASGVLITSARGSSFPTLLALYRGEALGSLQPIASSAAGGEAQVRASVTSGETIFIAVDGRDGASGNLYFSLTTSLAPNDDFANRLPIVGAEATVTGSNVGATSEPGETGQRTVWWKWVAPATGAFTFTTTGSSFDTWLTVFSAGAFPNLPLITENYFYTNRSRLTIKAEAGAEYQLQVSGDGGATGDIRLSVFPAVRPPNDDFATRTRLGNRNELVTGNNFDAAYDPVERAIEAEAQILYGSGRMVWWEWTSPIDGAVEIQTTNSVRLFGDGPVATKLIIFAGETFPPPAASVIRVFDPNGVLPASYYLTDVRAGTRYQIGLDSAPWEQPALFTLKIRAIAPPKIIASSVRIDAGGIFRARAEGTEGKSYVVRASANLIDWEFVSEHPTITGEFAFEAPRPTPYRFFRVEEIVP